MLKFDSDNLFKSVRIISNQYCSFELRQVLEKSQIFFEAILLNSRLGQVLQMYQTILRALMLIWDKDRFWKYLSITCEQKCWLVAQTIFGSAVEYLRNFHFEFAAQKRFSNVQESFKSNNVELPLRQVLEKYWINCEAICGIAD